MSKISKIIARQILDSRGNPTVEVEMHTEDGARAFASVPSGASTGSREALELRDGDKSYYMGKSVRKAISNINEKISPQIMGMEVSDLRAIDNKMLEIDGTDFKNNLGANAMLAVSMASCRAGAQEAKLPLYEYLNKNLNCPNACGYMRHPAPLMNIINGGEHASNNLDIQEFMIVPHMNKPFSENLRAGVEIFHNLKKVLEEKNYSTNVGDEGGFAPNLQSQAEAFTCIEEAVKRAGYKFGEEISISLDCAASEFYNKEKKVYMMDGKEYTSEQMIAYYEGLVNTLPIYSIEDGLDESDHEGWTKLTQVLGDKCVLVGDDLFVTNAKIFGEGIKNGEANAILVKINQIGTISETFDTLQLAYDSNYKTIISHRSGETADHFIADLAIASGAGHIKTGSASRSDRIEKYNQLLRIEEYMANNAKFDPIK
ncbi:MAG: phosphopyruvate hydratase [Flavobacteriaceae bacterium]|nr:phosphopyruvate hydratase [Flavobacteriaceae bacterium]